jgi:hypothetical protein
LFFKLLHQFVLVMPPSHIVIAHGWLAPLPVCNRRHHTGRKRRQLKTEWRWQ